MRAQQTAIVTFVGALLVFVWLVGFNLGRMTVSKFCEPQTAELDFATPFKGTLP